MAHIRNLRGALKPDEGDGRAVKTALAGKSIAAELNTRSMALRLLLAPDGSWELSEAFVQQVSSAGPSFTPWRHVKRGKVKG